MSNWLNRKTVPEQYAAVIREKYPNTETSEIAEELGITKSLVSHYARILHVLKSRDFMHKKLSRSSSLSVAKIHNIRCTPGKDETMFKM